MKDIKLGFCLLYPTIILDLFDTNKSLLNKCINTILNYNIKYDNSLSRSTFDGFFIGLLNDARKSALKRTENKRIEAGTFKITIDDFKNLWNIQEGKCFYSSIPMSTKPNSDWKCSPERLDPDKGYIEENLVLVCHELNNATQWSLDKMQTFIKLIQIKYDTDRIVEEIEEALYGVKTRRIPKNIEKKIIDDVEYYGCNFCDEYFTRDEFVQSISKGCSKCRSENGKKYKSSIKGKLTSLSSGGTSSTGSREDRETNRIENTCTITSEDLEEVLITQKGLCAYSGIKMNYDSYKTEDWMISLERIDPLKGYTRENICLICFEFNGVDHSSRAKYSNGGSGAWNKPKFDYFITMIKSKYNI